MSFLDGTVLRLDVAYVLAQPLLLALHPRSSSATNYGSTSWVRRVSNPRITSRLSALYSIPTNASSPHGQRVFNLDSNMRSLIISSDNGYSSTAIDLLSTGILWPSSITGPAVMDTNSSSQTVYLAEALGKGMDNFCWKECGPQLLMRQLQHCLFVLIHCLLCVNSQGRYGALNFLAAGQMLPSLTGTIWRFIFRIDGMI